MWTCKRNQYRIHARSAIAWDYVVLNMASLNFNNFNVESYDMHQYKSVTMLHSLTLLQLTDLRSELHNATISNYKTLMH